MTQTKTNIIQYSEYYPFGLQTANSWTRENSTGNNFLANGGTELNATTSLYDLEYRNYDPQVGRMAQVDQMADSYAGLSPYNYSFNDPMQFSDPNGADPMDDYRSMSVRDEIAMRNSGMFFTSMFDDANGMYGYSNSMFGFGGYAEMNGVYGPTMGELNARDWVRGLTGNHSYNAGETLTQSAYNATKYDYEGSLLYGNEAGTKFLPRGSTREQITIWIAATNASSNPMHRAPSGLDTYAPIWGSGKQG